ncbi:hypothetical protein KA005_10850, partial [bacterium]|nr:hypothetical protein [bacterium]
GKVDIFRFKNATEEEIANHFASFRSYFLQGYQVSAIIERVHSMPDQGVSSSFKFGMNYGFLRACLISQRIPFSDSTPKNWQKHYHLAKHPNESKTDFKRRGKAAAQNLYPGQVKAIPDADAVLIAHYALSLI